MSKRFPAGFGGSAKLSQCLDSFKLAANVMHTEHVAHTLSFISDAIGK